MPLEKILVADNVDKVCIDLLAKYEFVIDCKFKLSENELINEIPNYDAIIVRSETKVTEKIINAGAKGNLKVIGRAGIGVDNIDVTAATASNILVINAPFGNSLSAAELTCSLITTLARHVIPSTISLKDGKWDRKIYMGTELSGKTLAIIGLGRIGREVAHRMNAFNMKVIGFDPIVTADDAAKFNVDWKKLEEIWPVADYITVHVPLNNKTENLMNNHVFSLCKKGVKVINVARGGIINEEDLFNALEDGRCAAAGLDVYVEEPPKSEITWKLIKHKNVVATPHLGASTKEAQVRVAEEIATQLIRLAGKNKDFSLSGIVNQSVMCNNSLFQ